MAGDRQLLEDQLAAVEAQFRAGPASPDLRAERAGLLAALGQTEPAKSAYLEILATDPTHFTTLNNFGVLLHETQFRTAARTLFSEAIRHHPGEPLGHINLANLLMYEDDLALARHHYEIALRLDPANVHAHQRLSEVLHGLGDPIGMEHHRRLGFGPRPMRSFPYLGDGEPIVLLVLQSTPGADIAWPKFVDTRLFAVITLVVEFWDSGAALPPHDLIFNAIGDADLAGPSLLAAAKLISRSNAPVINAPRHVLETARQANSERLGNLEGVMAPRFSLLSRSRISAHGAKELEGQGFRFPLLLRSAGFHAGRHFTKVDGPRDLADAASALPGENLMAIEHLDVRGVDGYFRKYRVMMIGGRLYPLHLAISRDWKVHYSTADMAKNAKFRAEEARFLTDMTTAIGMPAMAGLEAIQSACGLDYGGIDFALDSSRRIVLFEANAVMNIIPPDASPQWDYRRAHVEAALAAARAMLTSRNTTRNFADSIR